MKDIVIVVMYSVQVPENTDLKELQTIAEQDLENELDSFLLDGEHMCNLNYVRVASSVNLSTSID